MSENVAARLNPAAAPGAANLEFSVCLDPLRLSFGCRQSDIEFAAIGTIRFTAAQLGQERIGLRDRLTTGNEFFHVDLDLWRWRRWRWSLASCAALRFETGGCARVTGARTSRGVTD